MSWKPTAGILTGNVFVRGDDRMLPLYEAKMIHHFDHRFRHLRGATQAQLNKGTLPHLHPASMTDPTLRTDTALLGQEFDTRDEQKSKPDKPVYDHGVTSGLRPSTGIAAGCSAGATSAVAPTSAQ